MSARFHGLSDALRVGVLGLAVVVVAGSASNQGYSSGAEPARSAPSPRAMDPGQAVGLWKSNFGPVKIEPDASGATPQAVQGAWRYEREGAEIIGVFWGSLRGNVLDFEWQEPSDDGELRGAGYLVFEPGGERFDGQWWTASGDRSGSWNGWRLAEAGLQ